VWRHAPGPAAKLAPSPELTRYTVGKATFAGADSWQSTYVTVWKRQSDGTWKVLFDTSRSVNEP
jgi:ketosteroid isomerase-like protein